MLTKNDGILIVLGCIIGILAAIIAYPLLVPAPGTGSVLPATSTVARPDEPGVAGTAASLGELTTKEDVAAFIRSHTETAGATPSATRDYTVSAVPGSARTFTFDVDTSSFTPDEYVVTASAVIQDATGTTLFNVLAPESRRYVTVPEIPEYPPVGSSGFYIRIDPISDKVVGDRFTITGVTNLPADAEILVQVYSSSFKPTQKSQSGEFSGATGTIRTSSYPSTMNYPVPTAMMTAAPTPVPTTAGAALPTRAYSTTNVQVQDVDEADIIKTDGENIYVVTGSCLHILKAYPASEAKFLSTLRFAGSPQALYAGYGRVVLITTDTWTRPITACTPGRCSYSSSATPRTLIYVFSVKDPANPALVREVDADGSYSSSRMIGTQLYFVTSTPVPSRLDDLQLPSVHDDHGGITTPPVYGFNTTDRSFAFSTIGSLDVTGTSSVPAKSFIIGTAGTIYASPTRLYIAVPDRAVSGIRKTTSVYSFTLDSGKIAYAAGGNVDGTLLSQYSLDEYDGNLRVATTINTGSWQMNDGSYSKVTVLDRTMAAIGTLSDIAPGERIYAARFMGDRLYLVTFRQTDPFFVIGLAEPRNPVILGKLKLPGFSNYLHPYDGNHIIGIGKESTSGPLKIALFDVTDVNNPVQQAGETLGGPGSTSPVLTEPRAFLFDQQKDILVLPVELHSESACTAKSCTPPAIWGGAYVYGVSPDKGFTLKGTVKHYSSSYALYRSQVKRALYIENTLYTMSDAKIVMSDLKGPVLQVNELNFQ
ncbi:MULTISPECIES: beta-propeller domain-containing protein [unclassified Methanoregula]|uniref:beta-propeller domain-containing protein n=1 Tax=unclassified Methanoregula TaxID=2649730 RepID=UPI0009D1427A|nr:MULTISPECIES: beta-propeller domain-containing protein [unclassified Methanoregula]OPX62528.1 MAG: Beta propeller domain protein [Methanoregula sp. PtaB.Bin085]OPY31627.1 MAG: Beta propeller domain protein [Methanoregula sp. PtaU1.Bin006]